MLQRMIPAMLCLLTLWQIVIPAVAQPYMRQTIERRLSEASSFFQQNDFEMGANRIREACSLLKSAPQSMPEANYVQIASSKADVIDSKLSAVMDKRDYDLAQKLVTAQDILLTSLSNWEPQNPRWHYQKAVLYHIDSMIPMTGAGAAMAMRLGIQNNLQNEVDMRPLQNSIQECEMVLRLADRPYRDRAAKLKSACQAEIQRRTDKLNAAHQQYYRKLPKGMPPPGMNSSNDTPPAEHYCSKCGGAHSSWICPFTHGG